MTQVTSVGMLISGRVTVSPSRATHRQGADTERMPIGRPLEKSDYARGRGAKPYPNGGVHCCGIRPDGRAAEMSNRRLFVPIVNNRYRSRQLSGQNHGAILVAPSLLRENSGPVMVEVMAAKVPAVATTHSRCDDQMTGMLHRPGDATSSAHCLRRAIADTDLNFAFENATPRSYEAHSRSEVGLAAVVAGHERDKAAASRWDPL